MVLRVKGTSWAGVGWRPRDLTAACKKFPVLADPPPPAPDTETTASPQGRSLSSAEAAVAEPEPETEPEPEAAPANEAALERALESEGAGGQQQAARNTRYGVHFTFVPLF
jgi:hypothetical protein